ncbi:MAG: hypothetical protein II696_00330, partial [Firmicutes bacterium]|nr:hypothetical protein [Bacillota bacterium]
MRSQNSFSERIQRSKRSLKRHRKLVTCLAAVVVFAVTYSLVLPAVTLDEQKAEETPGIETQTKVEEQVEKASANEKQENQAIEKADAGSQGDASGDSGEKAKAPAKSEESDSSASKDSGSAVKSDKKDSGIEESDKDKSDKDAKESSEDENKLIDEKTELKFDGNGYKVVAEVDADAKLPADTKL